MKKLLSLISICLLSQWVSGQTPKWVEKAKRSVFSVITYDQNNGILNTGNGFFVSEDGTALSDYSLFKGASRAVIINSDGKQMDIERILGANEMYDVVKFRVGILSKKVPALQVATSPSAAQADVWLLPYSTQKSVNSTHGKIKNADNASGNYVYYTLEMKLKDKMVSCPVMNTEGQVIGLVQKSAMKDTASVCYAVDARLADAQKITAFSVNDQALRSIGIKKMLPDTEEQALIYLFMASSQLSSTDYLSLLTDFVESYPNSSDGYLRRANQYLFLSKDDASYLDKASKDLEQALKVATKKDDAEYNVAKFIYAYQLSKPETTFGDWTFDRALEYIQSAYEHNPLPIYMQLEGDIFFAQANYEKAYSCYEQVNQSNLASPASFYSAAKTKQLMKGDPKEVLSLMDSCIVRCPRPVTADVSSYLLERAQVAMECQEYRKALGDYDDYFKSVNGEVNDLFYYYREQSALMSKQYQRALDDIRKAVELNPKEMLYRAENAALNLRVGRYDEAITIVNEALKLDPKYGELYRILGICQLQLKQKDKACTNFAKAKELGDPNAEALIEKHCK
ncbi:MAG: tetratricopeptide repeat protein [Bacteroides sp.]